jgi:hypothetical protein
MWISERHPNPPKPAAPPTETGRRLATLARGNDAELRVTLSEFQSRPYCNLHFARNRWRFMRGFES